MGFSVGSAAQIKDTSVNVANIAVLILLKSLFPH